MATHTLTATEITRLAHAVLLEAPAVSPLLVLVEQTRDGISFLAPPPAEVEGHDLLDQALGLVAPASCGAVAMAATGRAWPADGSAVDVVVAHALLRSGASATYLTDQHGAPLLLDDDPVGLVPDLCRRVLELPTSPPEVETDVYLSRLWLDRLLEAAAARPGSLTVPAAVALHPAEQAESLGREVSWLRLALATHEFMVAVPWAVLRRRFADAEVGVGTHRAREAAAWFDDGSFSRWMLAGLPHPDDALPALAELLPAGVHHEVTATLALAAELGVEHDRPDDDPEGECG